MIASGYTTKLGAVLSPKKMTKMSGVRKVKVHFMRRFGELLRVQYYVVEP